MQRNQFQKVNKVMCIGRDVWSCMYTYVRMYKRVCASNGRVYPAMSGTVAQGNHIICCPLSAQAAAQFQLTMAHLAKTSRCIFVLVLRTHVLLLKKFPNLCDACIRT